VVISDSLVNSDRIGIGLGSTSVIDCIWTH
jgi:hypothetical protein